MKLKIRAFKSTGKWNYDEELVLDCDITNLGYTVAGHYFGHPGYYEIIIIEEDGHEQPFRILDIKL